MRMVRMVRRQVAKMMKYLEIDDLKAEYGVECRNRFIELQDYGSGIESLGLVHIFAYCAFISGYFMSAVLYMACISCQ
jgi:hypothetical protein